MFHAEFVETRIPATPSMPTAIADASILETSPALPPPEIQPATSPPRTPSPPAPTPTLTTPDVGRRPDPEPVRAEPAPPPRSPVASVRTGLLDERPADERRTESRRVATTDRFDRAPGTTPRGTVASPPVRRTGFDGVASSSGTPREAPEPATRTGSFSSALRADDRGDEGTILLTSARPGAFEATTGNLAGARGDADRRSAPVVGSTGFDSTAGRTATAANGDGREIVAGGFGDAEPVVAPARPKRTPVEDLDDEVEIVSKPRPEYTDSARRLGIEGEVEIEVLFRASGTLRVLRVVRGLGHGLDEAAVAAVEGIEFKPARRAGRPVDHRVTLRVIFQLA